MQLITIEKYRENYFAKGSAPDARTVRRGIQRYIEGEPDGIPGRKVGNKHYVDRHKFEADDDPLVALVLEAHD